jgi:hypothetical protein
MFPSPVDGGRRQSEERDTETRAEGGKRGKRHKDNRAEEGGKREHVNVQTHSMLERGERGRGLADAE